MSTPEERFAALREAPRGVARLERLLEILRGPGGCPWDREQTHRSLAPYLLEEAHELLEAIDAGDDARIAEELGDVLLQVVFHAQLGKERGAFDLTTIAEGEVDKMVARHPHVFGSEEAHDAETVLQRWERRKRTHDTARRSVADGVPRALPALVRAQTISARAAGLGFDWADVEELWSKLREELDELAEHLLAAKANPEALEDELGDLLFVLVNVARKAGIDAESALRRATEKFVRRFDAMERPEGDRISNDPAARAAWDAAWEAAKRRLRAPADQV